MVGSANFTRRSLDDYNLDADVAMTLSADAPLAQQARDYFDSLWSNQAALGIEYTADFAVFANPSAGRLLAVPAARGRRRRTVLSGAFGVGVHRRTRLLRQLLQRRVGGLLEGRDHLAQAVGGGRGTAGDDEGARAPHAPSRRPMLQSNTTCTAGAAAPPGAPV